MKQRKGRKSAALGFRFFVTVCVILASTGIFVLVQRQFVVRNEIEMRKIEERIGSEKEVQEKLRVELARLESPGRVERVAKDVLGMCEVGRVIYLRFDHHCSAVEQKGTENNRILSRR
ncbi:MAG: hypothetical protein PHP64_04445 [Actinomycetota bacterium]|nr:hypothetical protein [Actinomycetota bacterium]